MDTKHRFKKGDILALTAVVLLAAVIFAAFFSGNSTQAGFARIYQNGTLLDTVSLNQNREFDIVGDYRATVTVKDGKIAITHSDCPGEDCVHSGWLDSPGRSVVCLPNGLEIRVVSGDSDVDFVVG